MSACPRTWMVMVMVMLMVRTRSGRAFLWVLTAKEEKMEAQKRAEELAIEQGELAIQGEITAQDEEEEDMSNMGGEFMDALAQNNSINPRPE